MKIRELVPEYQTLMQQGLGQEDILSIAKSRKGRQSNPAPIVATVQEPKENYWHQSDDVAPQMVRGLANTFVRSAELLNGATGVKIPKYESLVKLGEEMEQTKEKISKANITPERKAEVDAMSTKMQNAQGMDAAKVGVEQLWDVLTHPSEWTVQGVTETLTDPLNAVPMGIGAKIGTKVASPFLRYMIAGGAGATENAAMNSVSEYAIARGAGKSKEEAKKIAYASAAGGAVMGGALGTAGAAFGGKQQPQPKPKETPSVNMDGAFADLGEDVPVANGTDLITGERVTIDNPPAPYNTEINELVESGGTPYNRNQLPDKGGNKLGYDPHNKVGYNGAINIGAADGWSEPLGQRIQGALDARSHDVAFDIIEAEIQANSDHVATQKTVDSLIEQGVTDAEVIEATIENSINVSDIDTKITQAINEGKTLPPSYSGGRLVVKVANTIEAGEQSGSSVYARLKAKGASESLALKAKEAVDAGDAEIFNQWYAEMLQENLMPKALPEPEVKAPLKEGKLIDDVTGVREDVEYVVLPKEEIKTSFKSGEGYQYRSNQQGNVIRDIRENFDADRHFGSDGGFDGVPVVDSQGNVLIGNHRAEAIKGMDDAAAVEYRRALQKAYGVEEDGILVRRLKDDTRAEMIAKVSNDRRVKADSEKIIVDGAKYQDNFTKLPDVIPDEVSLKNMLGAADELESNRATLSLLSGNELPHALDRYMKENPDDLNFKQMLYKNAYKLYNISKIAALDGYGSLDIAPLLSRAIDKITVSKSAKAQNLNDLVTSYGESMKLGGKDIEGKVISSQDFAADVLGIALKHYRTLKDDGIVEFGRRMEAAVAYVNDAKNPGLFGEGFEPTLNDVIFQFLNETDRQRLDLKQLKQRIEENEAAYRDPGESGRSESPGSTERAGTADGADGVPAGRDSGVPADSTDVSTAQPEPGRSAQRGDTTPGDEGSVRHEELGDGAGKDGDRLPVETTRRLNEFGEVTDGVAIKPGEQFLTATDRETTPFPKQKSLIYSRKWLIENSIAEAKSRGDDFNARSFEGYDPKNLAPADYDHMNMYLFGKDQPAVKPSMLKDLAPERNALHDIENDISYDEAYNAHRGTSHVPEVRAKTRIEGYVQTLKEDFESLKKYADTPEKEALLHARFADYREGMKKRFKELLAKESRTMSPMITGPARFPTATNRKKMGYADTARGKYLDYRDRVMGKIRNELDPQIIKSDDVDAITKLRSKLDQQIKNHERMKEANKIMRDTKLSNGEKGAALEAIGFKGSKTMAAIAKQNGFASFELTNSNARMKATKARIAELEALEAREAEGKASTLVYEGARIEENIPAKRVQLFFDEKPDADLRTMLKKRGFRWSPKAGAWQRQLNANALRIAKEVVDDHFTQRFDKTTKNMMEC